MATFETYQAKADRTIARNIAGTTSPFTIEVRFLGGLTDPQKDAFKAASDRWTQVIVGDLPSVTVDGEVIDDLLILAQGSAIDGPGGILGQAGPTHLRPRNAGNAAFLPAKGTMQFDTADLAEMERDGTLNDVIAHEMGHVLGIGTIWSQKSLLRRSRGKNPVFIGESAMEEYGSLRGLGRQKPVPVENKGGPGTRNAHWRESIFLNELMSGFIAESGNPLSRMTVGSLKDVGYAVNLDVAEAYELPDLRTLAEGLLLMARQVSIDIDNMLTYIPLILPEDSLQSLEAQGPQSRER